MRTEIVDKERRVIEKRRSIYVAPQVLDGPAVTWRTVLTPEDLCFNRGILDVRHSLRQRTQFRIAFDVMTRRFSTTVYRTLRSTRVYVNCASPEQAELAIDAILSFAQSLDGKWLAPRDAQATDQPNVSGLGADSQAISEGLDRADQTAPVRSQDTPAPPTPGQNPGRPGEGE